MEEERQRIERAHLKNLEYIESLDRKAAQREAEDLLREHGLLSTTKDKKKVPTSRNTSVYITGLTTYMACKQLEGLCGKFGKVKRMKFYKDEKGGLKGDAIVTFGSHGAMKKAVEKLNHLEIKPGVVISATAAEFGANKAEQNDKVQTKEAKESSVNIHETHQPILTEAEPFDLVTSVQTAQESLPTGGASRTETGEAIEEQENIVDLPSKSIILYGIFDPMEPLDNPKFYDELEEDMRSECSKHGQVDHIHFVANGAVLVRFRTIESSIKCLSVMQGRWFAGRQIKARFDPSQPEEPEDEDTKLEAFLASIG